MPEESFGNLLQHFTGSGRHNEALRTEAVKRGLHVSEYGGHRRRDRRPRTTCATEEEVYELLGMAYVEPELREDRGELEAARKGELPELVDLEDIRGDLHCHTTASDGRNSIAEMAAAARSGATSTWRSPITRPARLRQPRDPRRAACARSSAWPSSTRARGLPLLAGSEMNILPDGSLDYDDELLAQLDWVVAQRAHLVPAWRRRR